MAIDRRLETGLTASSGTPQEINATADRLVLDVVSAVEDGYTGVPESQRLIAWLGVEFIPLVAPRFPAPPDDLIELLEVLDGMHGSSGAVAAELAVRSRSLVFRLL